ncbi:MAG: hypothetical protein IMZ61_13570 [Planctomycetes bacterium]|nr:hypothetical protein [Planctomycetota bacterium]
MKNFKNGTSTGSINTYSYLKQKQVQWAMRQGINLLGSAGPRGKKAYTATLEQNLFRALSPEALSEYGSGKGGELAANEAGIRKMQAVHSSAALTVNLFQYWREIGYLAPLLKALDQPDEPLAKITYERKLPIDDMVNRRAFPVDPHIDVMIACPTSSTAIECKFTEAYSSYKHAGIKPAYMELENLWQAIPECKRLAQSICPSDAEFPHLHPAQLLKHILGLKHAHKNKSDFRLIYLWYHAPSNAGDAHRKEIERFSDIVKSDGIAFKAFTFQEVIFRLAENHQPEHREYIHYLTERYL